jgi:hypothetical protein
VKKIKKLKVKRETVRELSVDQLKDVRGAYSFGGEISVNTGNTSGTSGCTTPDVNPTVVCAQGNIGGSLLPTDSCSAG